MGENRHLFAWIAISGLLFMGSIGLVGLVIGESVRSQHQVNRQVCIAFNRFNAVLTQTLERSAVNLPKLAYFQSHPDELAAQEREVRAQLRQFRQRPC